MTVQVYDNLPSSAIKSVTVNSENNTVVVQYTSNDKQYEYSTENATEFNKEFLAEFDDQENFSVGRFINSAVTEGKLTLLAE
jgi:capsular polysaccharide biosynthesis protein